MNQRRAAVAGVLLAGFLAAGCAQQAAPARHGTVSSCARVTIRAVRSHVTIASLPAACRDLTRAQLAAAADTAATALAGPLRGKTLHRARLRELNALLPPLPAAPPAPAAFGPAGGSGPGLPLGLAALVAWLLTVGLGLLLMARWLTRGGLRQPSARIAMNLAHLGLSVAGLAAWIGYLVTGVAGLAWAGCVLLMPVTGLGMSLLVLRTAWRRRLPAFTVAAHIALAVATLMLTLLAAIGAT